MFRKRLRYYIFYLKYVNRRTGSCIDWLMRLIAWRCFLTFSLVRVKIKKLILEHSEEVRMHSTSGRVIFPGRKPLIP